MPAPSFAFTFTVPLLSNPFSQTAPPPPHRPPTTFATPPSRAASTHSQPESDNMMMLDVHLSSTRKRAWMPSGSAPSAPTPSLATSASAWLDTPSKYIAHAAAAMRSTDSLNKESPARPAKRRRTIADSIISTAISAALIGTAVGIAAYRVWRDRGKTAETEREADVESEKPPPPYHAGDWVDVSAAPPQTPAQITKARRARRHHNATHSGSISYRRGRLARASSPRLSDEWAAQAPAPAASTSETELEVQIDSMGSKLAALIAQGKRALGAEVVVDGDDDEGEEPEAWVDADAPAKRHRISPATPRRNVHCPPPPEPAPVAASWAGTPSSFGGRHWTPAHVDDNTLSPELRASMDQARASVRARAGSASTSVG